MEAEPGCLEAFDHCVEPERYLSEFDGSGVEVDAIDLVKREVGLDLLKLARVGIRVDTLPQLSLAAGEVLLGELANRLDRECARPQGGLADRQIEDVAGRGLLAVLVKKLFQGLGDDEAGEDFWRVVGGGLLALTPGEAEDERTTLMQDRLLLAGDLILDLHEVVGRNLIGPVSGDHPRALGCVSALGDFVQVGLGKEAGVRHQTLVDGSELVDPKLGIGDESTVSTTLLLAEKQVTQHALNSLVAELRFVDQRGCAR